MIADAAVSAAGAVNKANRGEGENHAGPTGQLE